jgi:hypothetical protein
MAGLNGGEWQVFIGLWRRYVLVEAQISEGAS